MTNRRGLLAEQNQVWNLEDLSVQSSIAAHVHFYHGAPGPLRLPFEHFWVVYKASTEAPGCPHLGKALNARRVPRVVDQSGRSGETWNSARRAILGDPCSGTNHWVYPVAHWNCKSTLEIASGYKKLSVRQSSLISSMPRKAFMSFMFISLTNSSTRSLV
jgi:hypothetical protein